MASIFTKIVSGDIPSYKIAENDDFLAFLDINPLTEGHTLVIPKKEIDYFFDLDNELYSELMLFAKKVAGAIEKSVDCIRIGMVVYGLDVPHAHLHLIPLKGDNDIDFSKPKLEFTKDQFMDIAARIRRNFEA